jgi:quercetin dioxygenase-like cupin family protein
VSAFDELAAIAPLRLFDGVVARTVESSSVTLGVIELGPGSPVPEHSHDAEQVGVLARGSLRFRIGGEERELGPGGTWCIPANVPHSAVAGPEGAVAVEAFSPARADWRDLGRGEPADPDWPGTG